MLKTLKTKTRPEVPPSDDFRYMVNVVTSAIVNTPPYVLPRPLFLFLANCGLIGLSLRFFVDRMLCWGWCRRWLPKSTRRYIRSIQTRQWYVLPSFPLVIALICFRLRFQQPIFVNEPTGQPRKQKFIMGKRNWCRVEWDERTGEVEFDIRVEREKGCGVTTGWVVF